MDRREFLTVSSLGLSAAAATGLSARAKVRAPQAARAYAFDASPLGRTLKTPDGRVVFEYVVRKPADTDMSANSVCLAYGDFKIPHDQPLTLKYRVVAYDGVLPGARMDELAGEFRKASKETSRRCRDGEAADERGVSEKLSVGVTSGSRGPGT